MTSHAKMLQGILKTSHWTQEQLAAKIGVSFATVNSWLNGRSKPRETMKKRIQKLYLAQDYTKEVDPVYVTLVNTPHSLRPEDYVLLEKDVESPFDDETVRATRLIEVDDAEKRDNSHEHDPMFVANSVETVARGTQSAGRIYDKIDGAARAQVMFTMEHIAIARVVDWSAEL